MDNQQPATRPMKISEVKRTLSALVNEVYRGETRVLIEKSGIPVAALVSVRDMERLIWLEREKATRRKAMDAISVAFEGVPLEEIERELARIASEERERRFAVIDETREAFKDVPSEEIEQNAVAIVREIRETDQERDERWQILEAMRAPFRDVPLEEIEREAAKAIAEVRAERRAAREVDAKSA